MSTAISNVPKGKVTCLLCRGFISYKDSDRTRFKDHMLNEHDVKYDSDVVLAASVMSQKEKAYIVKCSLQRLSDISDNKVPTSGESLLPQPNYSSLNKSKVMELKHPEEDPLECLLVRGCRYPLLDQEALMLEDLNRIQCLIMYNHQEYNIPPPKFY